MKKYKQIDEIKTYGVRDLSRGKLTEAIRTSLSEPVLIIKNNKPQSVIIDYKEYVKMLKGMKNEK